MHLKFFKAKKCICYAIGLSTIKNTGIGGAWQESHHWEGSKRITASVRPVWTTMWVQVQLELHREILTQQNNKQTKTWVLKTWTFISEAFHNNVHSQEMNELFIILSEIKKKSVDSDILDISGQQNFVSTVHYNNLSNLFLLLYLKI